LKLRSTLLSTLSASVLCVAGSAAFAECADPIKVGVLHSLSGSMAISETTLKDAMLMLIEQQNAAGGLLGCELEAVVVDPASDWPLFAEKARELLTVNEVFLEELGVEKFALLGTDYVYPRTTNNILESYLMDKGIAAEDIFVNYTPFGQSDWATIVADVVALGEDGKQVGVISTINGDANIGFYKELAAAGISADDIPVVAFSVGENDPMEAHYIGFNMWVNAATQAGTTDVDAVRTAMYGQEFPNLTGGTAVMLPNHHLAKPVLIGEIQADGQFDIISQTTEVPGDAWTDFLPASAVLKSDWKDLGCGMYNVETETCVQLTSNY